MDGGEIDSILVGNLKCDVPIGRSDSAPGQFLYAAQHSVCTWNTRMWTLGKHIRAEVFHAVAATAENGEDGPYYLAVLIAYQLTAKPQVGVDYRGKNTAQLQ